MAKVRLTFRCCGCKETFSNLVDPEERSTRIVHCPFCSARCVVDFGPYRAQAVVAYKGKEGAPIDRALLPEILPTAPSEEAP